MAVSNKQMEGEKNEEEIKKMGTDNWFGRHDGMPGARHPHGIV